MYKLSNVYRPLSIDEDQDMWVATLSYYPHKTEDDDMMHEDVIEVRADSELLLGSRIEKILLILNA